jgi:hypothetical protein
MYTFDKQLRNTTFEDAVARTKQVLATKGFGVLTEADIQKTTKANLDVDIPAVPHPWCLQPSDGLGGAEAQTPCGRDAALQRHRARPSPHISQLRAVVRV